MVDLSLSELTIPLSLVPQMSNQQAQQGGGAPAAALPPAAGQQPAAAPPIPVGVAIPIPMGAVAAFNALAQAPEWTSCSDLTINHLYPLRNLSRVQTIHGLKIKAELSAEGGGSIDIILPTKLARLTDAGIAEINNLIVNSVGPSFVFRGMQGRAFNVELKYPWE